MPGPTPTATANPYAPNISKPALAPSAGTSAIPATVSTTTSESIITAGQNRSAAHNALILSQSGRKVSGGKRGKSRRGKSRRGKSRRGKSRRGKSRRGKSRRGKSRRGGQPTPTPTPTPNPTVSVPQFAGSHNAGANANSTDANNVAMIAARQSALDNTNAPPSTTTLP